MAYRFSLAFLTVYEVEPPEAVRIAAECGYDLVGLRLLPAAKDGPYRIMTDDGLLAETLAAMKETGVAVADIEIIRIGEHFDLAATEPFLARGQMLGAKHILVAGDDPDEARFTLNYGRFCDLAARYGLTCDLEFMPWTQVPNLIHAMRVIKAANRANAGLLVDALHFDRSHSTLAQLAEVNPALLHYVQMNDALADYDPSNEGLIRIAREERLYPGEGQLNLKGILGVIAPDAVISLEIPHLQRASTTPALERARAAIEAMKTLIRQVQ